MTSTFELLEKALQKKHAAAWARDLNMTRAAFTMAKRQGRLSPVLAGNIAAALGENPVEWIAVAALETERESDQLTRLRGVVNKLLKC